VQTAPSSVRVLAALALLLGARSAAAMPFAAEHGLSQPAANESVLWQRSSQAVFDGENYVVIWENDRSGFRPDSGGFHFATRVSEDGTVLDERGILVARDLPSLLVSTAAPWGTLIVYPKEDGIVGLRLGRDGRLDLEPRTLAEGSSGYPTSTVACLDSGCLLAFRSGFGADARTLGFALDGCGERVPGTDFELPAGAWTVRAGSDGYVALGRVPEFAAVTSLLAFGLSADGVRRFGPVTIPAPQGASSAFSVGPSGSLVVWSESASELRAACLDPNGRIVGENRVLESAEALAVGDMSAEGDHYRLGVQIGTSVTSFAVDVCGRPLEPPVTVAAGDGACTLSVRRLASGTRSAWLSWDWGMEGPACEKPPAAGAVVALDQTKLIAAVDVQQAAGARMGPPALGSDGAGYLAAWYEDRYGASGLYTQALSADGEPLEDAVLTIPSESHPTPSRTASVAFVGGRYVVELHASEYSSQPESWNEPNAAAEIDPRTLVRGEPRAQPKLGAPGANTFLEAYGIVHRKGGEDLPTLSHLGVVVTDASKRPLSDEWTRPFSYGSQDFAPEVAFDGSSFGVVWRHREPIADSQNQLEQIFMKFDETGRPLLPEPRVIPGLGELEPASLTFGGGIYLLTLFTRDRAEVMVRLTTEGELLDAEPRSLLGATGLSLSRQAIGSVFDGEAFVLAWSERALGPPSPRHTDGDIRVAEVAVNGTLLANGWVTSSPENELSSAGLASAGDGRALLGYNRFDDDPTTLALRGVVRVLGSGECDSGTACSDEACDEPCCVRGCARSAPGPSCEVADCDPACDEGARCVQGLGCVTDAARPASHVVRAAGCGCTIVGRERREPWCSTGGPAFGLLLVLGLGWRRRRTRGAAIGRAFLRCVRLTAAARRASQRSYATRSAGHSPRIENHAASRVRPGRARAGAQVSHRALLRSAGRCCQVALAARGRRCGSAPCGASGTARPS
jgi:hypothetical protein